MANGNRSTFSIKFIIIVCHILIKIKIEEKHRYFRNGNVVFIFTEKWHNNSEDKKRQW